jgi:hypothetical protein
MVYQGDHKGHNRRMMVYQGCPQLGINSYVYSIANRPDLYKLTCLLVGLIESRAMVAVGDGFEGDRKGPSFGLTPALSTAWRGSRGWGS